MRRAVIAVAASVALLGGSVATASVTSIDRAADAGTEADRLSPPFRDDIEPTVRVALELVDLVNLERAQRGLPRLRLLDAAMGAAAAHAADMAAHRTLEHRGSDGSDAGDRLERGGFVWRTWGETIGGGFSTPESLLEAWMDSNSHRAHLLSENRYVGAGVVATPDGVPYWTLVVVS